MSENRDIYSGSDYRKQLIDEIYYIAKDLRFSYSDMMAMISKVGAQFDLTAQQVLLLLVFDEKSDITNTTLYDELSYSKGTISGLVSKLEKRVS